jgi:DNA-binding transcriptional LysR family regulator
VPSTLPLSATVIRIDHGCRSRCSRTRSTVARSWTTSLCTGITTSSTGVVREARASKAEQALPELRLGTLDLAISDEYDGHPRRRPPGLRFEVLHEESLRVVLPAAHPFASRDPVAITALRDDVWVGSAAFTGHHALVVSTCRSLGGFDPDLRHRSNDADVQLELVRSTGAVALLPTLTIPLADPTLAVCRVAEADIRRRLLVLTRDRRAGPALATVITAVTDQARLIDGG